MQPQASKKEMPFLKVGMIIEDIDRFHSMAAQEGVEDQEKGLTNLASKICNNLLDNLRNNNLSIEEANKFLAFIEEFKHSPIGQEGGSLVKRVIDGRIGDIRKELFERVKKKNVDRVTQRLINGIGEFSKIEKSQSN